MSLLLAMFLVATSTATPDDSELWNEGVEAYRAGEVTNALMKLRPLQTSRRYGARAATAVAALAYQQAAVIPDNKERLKAREEAAASAAQAARELKGSEVARRNLDRSRAGLAELRDLVRIDELVAKTKGRDEAAALRLARDEMRELQLFSQHYRTNAPPDALKLADHSAKAAERLADEWIVARQVIAQAVTNEEAAADFVSRCDESRARVLRLARKFADFDGDIYGEAALAEEDFHRLFKQVASAPMAIGESLLCQSNAYDDVELVNGRAWQKEALDFTRNFRARFPQWARDYAQRAAVDTNLPPFTAEAEQRISVLADQLEKLQIGCCEKEVPAQQVEARRLAEEIVSLLPKESSKGSGKGQVQNSPTKGEQPPNKEPDKSPTDEPKANEPEADTAETEEEDQKSEAQDSAEDNLDADEQQMESILKKAQERSDEHEAEKRLRMRKAPLPPNERDW